MKKWSVKSIVIWCVVILVLLNSVWTVMQSGMSSMVKESDVKINALASKIAEIEKKSSSELDSRIAALEKKFEDRGKIEDARRKALYDQIKVLEEELKHLEEKQ